MWPCLCAAGAAVVLQSFSSMGSTSSSSRSSCPSVAWCFAGAAGGTAAKSRSSCCSSCCQFFAKIFYSVSILFSVSRVSEATLDTFLVWIFGLVRPPGPWCFPVRQGCVAVSLCSSCSSSTSSSSSSRPSVAWCFAGAAGGTSRSSSCSQFLQRLAMVFLGFQKQR